MIDKNRIYTKKEFEDLLKRQPELFQEHIVGYGTIDGKLSSRYSYYYYLPHDNFAHEGRIESDELKAKNIPNVKNWQDYLDYFNLTRFNDTRDLIEYAKKQMLLLNVNDITPEQLNKEAKEYVKKCETDFQVKERNKSFYEGYYSGIIGILRYILGCGSFDRVKHCDEVLISYVSNDYK